MNKEDVRKKMLDILGDIYHAKFVEHGLNGYTKFDGHTWQEAKDTINTAFDRITIDHPKVKLPRDVGEELEDWLKTDSVDTIITDLVCVSEGDPQAVRDWWDSTLDATYLIADMARYGWEAEPEAKWYVKAPESWKADGSVMVWLYKPSRGGVDMCIHSGESDEQFTRAEIKQYHLDSDIFTKIKCDEND